MHTFYTKYKGKHLAQDASGLPCITCDLSCNRILDHNWWETQLVMDTNRERHSFIDGQMDADYQSILQLEDQQSATSILLLQLY